jgi:hypothetical protein
MADTVKTIGTSGDYADPILWAAGQGAVDDGNRQVGELISGVTMSELFRPNQAFPNGGLLRGNTTVTGKTGDGRTLGNTSGTRICLSPTDGFNFQDIEFDKGTNTYIVQNIGNNTMSRCLMADGFIYYTADKTLTLNNCVIKDIDGLASATQGNVVLNNTTMTDRMIIRAETLLTVLNSNSVATDWLLGRGDYTNSETLVNYCYIKQNAPAGDFGTGSSNNTLNTDTTLEMVNFAGGDYRIKSTSTLATAGQGGTFIGAFLEAGGGGSTLTADSGTYLHTGTDAQLLTTRILKADAGAYLHTGTSVSLLKGFVLTAQSGNYSYLGQDATLTYTPAGAFILTADSGNYTYTGSNINFNRDRVIIASSGTYNCSGTDIQIILPGQIWTDKPSASTNWNNQTVTTTIWTDK